MRTAIDPARLRRLLYPKSIAVCGGAICEAAIVACQTLGFRGSIHAINPTRDQLAGIPCTPTLNQLGEPVDALFLARKHEECITVVEQASQLGVGGVVCYASGFAELGDDAGKLRQTRLVAAASAMPIIGPNCYGTINYLDRASLWPDVYGKHNEARGVAILSQSGNIALNFTMSAYGLSLAFIIALGNQANCDAGHCLRILAEDPRITAIGLHLEGVSDPQSLFDGLQATISHKKPVVILKTATSAKSEIMALGHTASISGQHAMFVARCQAMGVAVCVGIDEFLATLKLLHIAGPLPDKRFLSLSCSGGEATIVSDLADHYTVDMIDLSMESVARINAIQPAQTHCVNPFDYHTYFWGNEQGLHRVFAAALMTGFDAAMLIIDFPVIAPDHPDWHATISAFHTACKAHNVVPIICATMPEGQMPKTAKELVAKGLVPIIGLSTALAAVQNAHITANATYQHFLWQSSTGRTPLNEYEAKTLLGKAGLDVPQGALIKQGACLPDFTTYPACVKPCAATLEHKTETGLLALNIQDLQQLEKAIAACHMAGFDAYAEEMIPDAIAEMLISVTCDYASGFMMVIAPGGTLAELCHDKLVIALPASRDTIDQCLRNSPMFRIIRGFRATSHKGNYTAFLKLCTDLAELANTPHPPALEINPVIITEKRAVIADILMQIDTE
ncbi:MAG: acetate--CoA ligase family protein [Pseudomonadota bacterium]